MPQTTRLNYSIDDRVAEQLDRYCAIHGLRRRDVARRVILDFMDSEDETEACTVHPTGRRADLWVQPATLETLDRRVKLGCHASRSALINHLLAVFLRDRVTDYVAVTVNIPIAVWEQLGDNPTDAVLRAVESFVASRPESSLVKEYV